MSLVVTEDESKEPIVMEKDEQTKVQPVSTQLCTFIFYLKHASVYVRVKMSILKYIPIRIMKCD